VDGMKITDWILVIIFGAVVLAIILAIYLVPIGSFVQSQNNNTFVQLIGMSGAVNLTGLSMISLGKTLQLSLIVLGILVMVVIVGLLLIINFINKNKQNPSGGYPPF
jgi:hypothetical protein